MFLTSPILIFHPSFISPGEYCKDSFTRPQALYILDALLYDPLSTPSEDYAVFSVFASLNIAWCTLLLWSALVLTLPVFDEMLLKVLAPPMFPDAEDKYIYL